MHGLLSIQGRLGKQPFRQVTLLYRRHHSIAQQGQDSSEEEEEEDNEYDLTDKFIAEEGEDEEGEDEEGSEGGRRRKHKHKRRREKSAELDDDDYQLLADNQVTVSILCLDSPRKFFCMRTGRAMQQVAAKYYRKIEEGRG